MFPLERFLNLFKGVPWEKPEIFDARDILSQVLVLLTLLVFSFPTTFPWLHRCGSFFCGPADTGGLKICGRCVLLSSSHVIGTFQFIYIGGGLCYLTRFGLVSLSIRRSVPAGLLFRYRWTIGVVVFYPSVRCLDSTFVCTNQNKKSVCEGQFGNVVCFVSCSFCLETSVHFASYLSICVFVYWHIDIVHIRLHLWVYPYSTWRATECFLWNGP